jgi:hypothetical protein
MIDFIRSHIRRIVYEEYNHIIIDSQQYLEFEDLVINSLYQNNYLEEGFSLETIIKSIRDNMEKK